MNRAVEIMISTEAAAYAQSRPHKGGGIRA